jgi:hypothetical protein
VVVAVAAVAALAVNVGRPGLLPTSRASARSGSAAGAGSGPARQPSATVHLASAHLRRHVCLTRPAADQLRRLDPSRTVPARPTGVTVQWLPGMNQRPCRTVVGHYDAELAGRLAADLRHAPRFPRGIFSCPMDDASAVSLSFIPAAGGPARVIVGLRGCAVLRPAVGPPLRMTAALHRDLGSVAPSPWRALLA